MTGERDAWLQGVLTGTEPGQAERAAAVAAYRERHRHWLECGKWLENHLQDERYPERSHRLEGLTISLSRELEKASQLTGLTRKELIAMAEEDR